MVLQFKEAEASVLEPFLGASEHANHGERVVQGQRLMQAASDIMLGWIRTPGIDGVERDFYVRQLWDNKGSADVERMNPSGIPAYARMCGWAPAQSHGREPDPRGAGHPGSTGLRQDRRDDANANQFLEEVRELIDDADPAVEWLCIEASAVADVDYTAAETLRQVVAQLPGARRKVGPVPTVRRGPGQTGPVRDPEPGGRGRGVRHGG